MEEQGTWDKSKRFQKLGSLFASEKGCGESNHGGTTRHPGKNKGDVSECLSERRIAPVLNQMYLVDTKSTKALVKCAVLEQFIECLRYQLFWRE